MRVSHVIWQTPYGDDSVGAYASGLPGYESGHTLQGNGDLLVLVGGIAFAIVLGVSRRVGQGAVIAGVVLSVIPPPFIIPAFGVAFLLAWLLRPMSRRTKQGMQSTTPRLS
jgi:drug/metabolite transporter (DMT)-like permease